MSKCERERTAPHARLKRTETECEFAFGSSWSYWGCARSRSTDDVVFDDQWRLESSLRVRVRAFGLVLLLVLLVVGCWLLGNFAAHTLRCCAAAAKALHGPFLAWTAQQRKKKDLANICVHTYTHVLLFLSAFAVWTPLQKIFFLALALIFAGCWLPVALTFWLT